MYGLSLADKQLTGIDLKLFGKLTQLRRLDVRNTPLGDSFLSVLSNLGNLEYLNLVGTTVSDEGLKYIVQLKGLRKVYCCNTKISVEAINNLKLKYPQLSIITGL
jgi:Leucine-rich repeat (LRR) protein